MIRTIMGDEKRVGITLMHEHLSIDLSAHKTEEAQLNDYEAILKDLIRLKELGASTLVDVTNRGINRDLKWMEKLSKESGIQVVAATGYYVEPFLPEEVGYSDVDDLAQIMIEEIENGIDNSEIRAGIIGEIGSSENGLTEYEKKVFEAAVIAQCKTGAAIYTHTTLGKNGEEQIDFLRRHGADLSRVIIGHVDLQPDMAYYLRLLEAGCMLGFDTIGKISYLSDEIRIEMLVKLVQKGFERQIVLSTDVSRKAYLEKYGGNSFAHIFTFLDKLKAQGVTEKAIQRMMIENPNRLLDF